MKVYRSYEYPFFAIKSTESEGLVSFWENGTVCVDAEEHLSGDELEGCYEMQLDPSELYEFFRKRFHESS